MKLETAISLIHLGLDHSVQQQHWGDLGAGKGLFTQALSTMLGHGSTIVAVDKDDAALRTITLPTKNIKLQKVQMDFSKEEWAVEKLDGLLMANSLHFIRQKEVLLLRLANKLKENGKIIVVEYDTDHTSPWVPYPVSFTALQKLATMQFPSVTRLAETPSAFGRANIYAALLQR